MSADRKIDLDPNLKPLSRSPRISRGRFIAGLVSGAVVAALARGHLTASSAESFPLSPETDNDSTPQAASPRPEFVGMIPTIMNGREIYLDPNNPGRLTMDLLVGTDPNNSMGWAETFKLESGLDRMLLHFKAGSLTRGFDSDNQEVYFADNTFKAGVRVIATDSGPELNNITVWLKLHPDPEKRSSIGRLNDFPHTGFRVDPNLEHVFRADIGAYQLVSAQFDNAPEYNSWFGR